MPLTTPDSKDSGSNQNNAADQKQNAASSSLLPNLKEFKDVDRVVEELVETHGFNQPPKPPSLNFKIIIQKAIEAYQQSGLTTNLINEQQFTKMCEQVLNNRKKDEAHYKESIPKDCQHLFKGFSSVDQDKLSGLFNLYAAGKPTITLIQFCHAFLALYQPSTTLIEEEDEVSLNDTLKLLIPTLDYFRKRAKEDKHLDKFLDVPPGTTELQVQNLLQQKGEGYWTIYLSEASGAACQGLLLSWGLNLMLTVNSLSREIISAPLIVSPSATGEDGEKKKTPRYFLHEAGTYSPDLVLNSKYKNMLQFVKSCATELCLLYPRGTKHKHLRHRDPRREIPNLVAEIDELTAQVEEQKSMNDQLKAEVKEQQSVIDQLKAKLKEQEAEIARLRVQNENFRTVAKLRTLALTDKEASTAATLGQDPTPIPAKKM